MADMKPCPSCGNPGDTEWELELDSSSIASASWIECEYCEFRYQANRDEESLVKRWNALDRSSTPPFEPEEP